MQPESNSQQPNQANPTPGVPVNPPQPVSPPPVSTEEPKGSKLPVIAVGILVLLVVAAGAYLLYARAHTKKQTAAAKNDIPLVTFGYETFGSDNAIYPAATNLDPNYDVNMQSFEGLVQFKNIN